MLSDEDLARIGAKIQKRRDENITCILKGQAESNYRAARVSGYKDAISSATEKLLEFHDASTSAAYRDLDIRASVAEKSGYTRAASDLRSKADSLLYAPSTRNIFKL